MTNKHKYPLASDTNELPAGAVQYLFYYRLEPSHWVLPILWDPPSLGKLIVVFMSMQDLR